MRKTISGFTIVELLIVIVVVAILAAISIVAYNGIQTRANNAQTIDAAKQYIKAFNLYAIDNSDYPNANGCLGNNYPAPNNRCLSQAGASSCFGLGSSSSQVVTDALKPYMGNKVANPSPQGASCGGDSYIGLYSNYATGSKFSRVYMILLGDQVCPAMSPGVAATVRLQSEGATLCRYELVPAGQA